MTRCAMPMADADVDFSKLSRCPLRDVHAKAIGHVRGNDRSPGMIALKPHVSLWQLGNATNAVSVTHRCCRAPSKASYNGELRLGERELDDVALPRR